MKFGLAIGVFALLWGAIAHADPYIKQDSHATLLKYLKYRHTNMNFRDKSTGYVELNYLHATGYEIDTAGSLTLPNDPLSAALVTGADNDPNAFNSQRFGLSLAVGYRFKQPIRIDIDASFFQIGTQSLYNQEFTFNGAPYNSASLLTRHASLMGRVFLDVDIWERFNPFVYVGTGIESNYGVIRLRNVIPGQASTDQRTNGNYNKFGINGEFGLGASYSASRRIDWVFSVSRRFMLYQPGSTATIQGTTYNTPANYSTALYKVGVRIRSRSYRFKSDQRL